MYLLTNQIFYLCINIGSLSSIATTEMEQRIGFWSAFVLCLCMFVVGILTIVVGKKFYVVRPPRGSVVVNAFRAIWVGLMNQGKMDAAKPSYQAAYGKSPTTRWNDLFIDELKRALVACRVFVFFPIYWVCYTQMLNNFVSQAGTMELHGIPNDIMQNIDSLTIIIFIPICDNFIYPALRRIGIKFRPITRITMGFVFASLSMAYAAIVQHLIYSAGPCYKAPLACDAAGPDEDTPNSIHVAVQTPAYLFLGLSEIFASITGLEYAFTKAPPSMKSFIMSIFLLQNAFGSALGIALSPTAVDPKLLWMYSKFPLLNLIHCQIIADNLSPAGLACATISTAVIFWFLFSKYNATEDEMNALEHLGDKAVPVNEMTGTGAVRDTTAQRDVGNEKGGS